MAKKRTLGYFLVSSEDHSFFLKKGRMVTLSEAHRGVEHMQTLITLRTFVIVRDDCLALHQCTCLPNLVISNCTSSDAAATAVK